MIYEQQQHHYGMENLNYNILDQSDDERLVFEVLVDSFKAELNKILYSNSVLLSSSSSPLDSDNCSVSTHNNRMHAQKRQQSPSRLLANIKKKQLFTILFQLKSNSPLNEELTVII
jgi:hypothetical protein